MVAQHNDTLPVLRDRGFLLLRGLGGTIVDKTPELNKAFAAARKEIKNPSFDSENPHFRSKFASLQAVMNATIPKLAEHGISVHQDLQTADGGIACYTHLCHESGEEKVYGPLVIPFTKHDAQGYASASTYARRYHLMGVVGVVGDNDDDGNAASESAFKSKQAKTKYWKGLKDAASEDDSLKARELWDELNNEQRQEVWRDLSSGIRSTIKGLLDQTKEEDDEEATETPAA